MPPPSEKAIALEMIALDLARLVRQASALELPLLPYLIEHGAAGSRKGARRGESDQDW